MNLTAKELSESHYWFWQNKVEEKIGKKLSPIQLFKNEAGYFDEGKLKYIKLSELFNN